jgi:hypothetical protein
MILLFLWDRLAGLVAVELDQDMTEGGDTAKQRKSERYGGPNQWWT